MKNVKEENVKRTAKYILLFLCIAQVAFIIYMNFVNMKYMVDYDSSSALMQAKEIWKQKKLFPSFWEYTTTLNIDSLSLIVALLYGITKDILLSQAIGDTIIILLYIFVLYGILKKINLDFHWRIIGLILFFMPYTIGQLGYSTVIFTSVAWYSVRLFTVLLSIYTILCFREYEYNKKTTALLALTSLICALATGLSSGLFVLLCGIFPILMYEISDAILENNMARPRKVRLIYEFALLFIGMLGVLFQRHLGFESKDASMVLVSKSNWLNNIARWFVGIYQLYGGVAGNENTLIFSLEGFRTLANWCIVTGMLFAVIYLLLKCIRYKKWDYRYGYFYSVIFVNTLILTLAYTTYGGDTFEYRYHVIPMVGVMFIGLIVCQDIIKNTKRIMIYCLFGGGFALLVLSMFGNDLQLYSMSKYTETNTMEQLGNELINNNIGNAIVIGEQNIVAGRCLRVFSGDVNIITVNEDLQNISSTTWGGSKKNLDNYNQNGKTAIITQEDIFESLPNYIKNSVEFKNNIDGYYIYIGNESKFDFLSGMDDEFNKLIDFPYSPNYVCQNGTFQDDGTFISNEDGGTIMYGPYSKRVSGEWVCTLNYKILDSGNEKDCGVFSITANNGQKILASQTIQKKCLKAQISNITIDPGDENVEMTVNVSRGVKIQIQSIKMKKQN